MWFRGSLSLLPLTVGLVAHAQAPLPGAPMPEPAPSGTSSPVPVAHTPTPEPRRVRQPIHEYFAVFDPQKTDGRKIEDKVNPFVTYTHLGTDFGFIGTGQEGIGAQTGEVIISMPAGYWGGMWHGLAGMGNDLDAQLDFRACYPPFFKAGFQPRIVGFELRGKGRGILKVEIKSALQQTLWAKPFSLDTPDMRTLVEPLNSEHIGKAKYLNWVAESGTEATLDSVAFIVQVPAIPFDEYVFLASYAKLAHCFSLRTAYVKDRAHIRDGYFDNVPASGIFALGTAVASRMGIVTETFAKDLLERVHDNVARLETAHGLLPHFVKRMENGHYGIVPGTEYSSVDTSIYYHAMLLAAEILGNHPMTFELTDRIRKVSLDGTMLDSEGFIRHGVREDRVTPIRSVWKDWGGESALVLALASMTDKAPTPKMDTSGRVYDGVGFIAEIQSLFYPDFDRSSPDAVTHQNWLEVRQNMLARQKEYFPKHWPDSEAARNRFYGLSAGEARQGLGYMVSGVELPQQSVIHPHYVLISGSTEKDPDAVYEVLRKMEEHQLFPPWGMVENLSKGVDDYLPMLGALNAGFECLGAYHLFARHRGLQNIIYEASRSSKELRRAASVFYPEATTSAEGSKMGISLTER